MTKRILLHRVGQNYLHTLILPVNQFHQRNIQESFFLACNKKKIHINIYFQRDNISCGQHYQKWLLTAACGLYSYLLTQGNNCSKLAEPGVNSLRKQMYRMQTHADNVCECSPLSCSLPFLAVAVFPIVGRQGDAQLAQR